VTGIQRSSSLGKRFMLANQSLGFPYHIISAIDQDKRLWRHGSILWAWIGGAGEVKS
jgi:hypothetical protein